MVLFEIAFFSWLPQLGRSVIVSPMAPQRVEERREEKWAGLPRKRRSNKANIFFFGKSLHVFSSFHVLSPPPSRERQRGGSGLPAAAAPAPTPPAAAAVSAQPTRRWASSGDRWVNEQGQSCQLVPKEKEF